MAEITLHGFAPSTYTRSARMAALEKGVAHTLTPLAYGEPAHLALHPFGKMPAMTHNGVTIFETLAIMSYLDRMFQGPRLIPEDPMAQGKTLTAISVAIDYAYQPIVHTGKTGDTIDPDDLAAAARVFDWLEASLSHSPFTSGPQMGAADLFLLPMLDHHVRHIDNDAPFKDRPMMEAWFASMTQRPSFIQTAAD